MNETFLYLVLSAFSFLLAVIAVILKCSQSRKKPGSLQLILGCASSLVSKLPSLPNVPESPTLIAFLAGRPMFAGKSTLLVRMAKWRRFCGSRCIIVKVWLDRKCSRPHRDEAPLSSPRFLSRSTPVTTATMRSGRMRL